MDLQRENLVKLVFGSLSVCVFLIALCICVQIFFPADSDSNVVPLSSKTTKEMTEAKPEDSSCEEEVKVKEEEIDFVADLTEETDVGIEFDFPLSNTDAGLVLYRQSQSRSAVEWFYSQVTGNREVAVAVLDAASEFNISPVLAFSLAYAESQFKTNVKHTNVNGTVDRGLFQLNSNSFPKLTEEEFYDPRVSSYYGMSHLKYCLETAGNEIAGLAMYNAGRNRVQNNSTPQSTLNYISTIENFKSNLQERFASEVISFYSSGRSENYLVKY